MKALKSFLEKNAYDFSSVQAEIPEPLATIIRLFGDLYIPESTLTDDGREDDIHVTIKYGIHITDFTALQILLHYEIYL